MILTSLEKCIKIIELPSEHPEGSVARSAIGGRKASESYYPDLLLVKGEHDRVRGRVGCFAGGGVGPPYS